ncbi:MAG: tryptophan-rich sensory protein [Pseudolabrys sp.]|nr:tryptophan-rich sensory protein [Pseudolabrys sp.]
MKRLLIPIAFIAGVVGIGMLIGSTTRPDGWYAALAKPSFNPPNWVFAPVWSLLYVLIAIAGARTFERGPARDIALWFGQMALNFAWTPMFFGLHQPRAALAVIVALLAAILAFIAVREKADRISALLFAPYALWVASATLLNASIVILN